MPRGVQSESARTSRRSPTGSDDKTASLLRLRIVSDVELIETSNRIKLHALYVQVTGNKIVSPSESITEAHAATKLDFANRWLAFLEMLRRLLR